VYLQIDDGHAEIRGAKVLLDGERVVGAQAIFFGEFGNLGLLIYNAIKNRWSFQ